MLDERFKNNQNRVNNRAVLNDILIKKIENWVCQDLLSQLRGGGVPAGAIRNMQEVFENPAAQHMILEENISDTCVTKRVKTVAFKIPNLD
jgi:crotonobetainyl-CoA:carnitine CoA-transferase CaiB-like acyl-CoA transferase